MLECGLSPKTVFLSTPSARRATFNGKQYFQNQNLFLSTPSARRATCAILSLLHLWHISIHALREEGDQGLGFRTFWSCISIHALREEGDV